jgi:hypothetical protein
MGLYKNTKPKPEGPPAWVRDYLLDGHRPASEQGVPTSDEASELILAVEYAGELGDVWKRHGPGLLEEWARRGRRGDPWAVRELRRQEAERAARQAWTASANRAQSTRTFPEGGRDDKAED